MAPGLALQLLTTREPDPGPAGRGDRRAPRRCSRVERPATTATRAALARTRSRRLSAPATLASMIEALVEQIETRFAEPGGSSTTPR